MDIDSYIKDRLDDQINWYSNKSGSFKCWHERISMLSIVLGALVALIPTLVLYSSNVKTLSIFVSSILGAIIVIIQAIDKLKKYKELHIQYRYTCERLKHEKYMFQYKAGDYLTGDSRQLEGLFIERCESIMSTEVSSWASLSEKKKE